MVMLAEEHTTTATCVKNSRKQLVCWLFCVALLMAAPEPGNMHFCPCGIFLVVAKSWMFSFYMNAQIYTGFSCLITFFPVVRYLQALVLYNEIQIISMIKTWIVIFSLCLKE